MSDVKIIPITDKYRDGWERVFGKPVCVFSKDHTAYVGMGDGSVVEVEMRCVKGGMDPPVWDGDRT